MATEFRPRLSTECKLRDSDHSSEFDASLLDMLEGLRVIIRASVIQQGRELDPRLCTSRLSLSAILVAPEPVMSRVLYIGPPGKVALANDNRWGIGAPA